MIDPFFMKIVFYMFMIVLGMGGMLSPAEETTMPPFYNKFFIYSEGKQKYTRNIHLFPKVFLSFSYDLRRLKNDRGNYLLDYFDNSFDVYNFFI